MLPHESNAVAFAGYHKAVASGLGVSLSLVDQWCLPPESGCGGTVSPTQRFLQCYLALRNAHAPKADALIEYVCCEAGGVFVRLADVPDGVCIRDGARVMRECGDYLCVHADRLSDGSLSADDAAAIAREAYDLLGVVAAQLQGLRAIVVAGDEEATRQRIGPQRVTPKYQRMRREAS